LPFALLSCSAPEQPADIAVSDGWTREIAPGQSAAAVYLTIANNGAGSDRLVQVESAQGDAALHETSSAGGVARMRALDRSLEIGPRSRVELKPGGTHIMVTGLKQRPAQGQTFGLTLGFERSGKRAVAIRVVTAGGEGHAGHGMGM
jgi:copper(I)-binding protein